MRSGWPRPAQRPVGSRRRVGSGSSGPRWSIPTPCGPWWPGRRPAGFNTLLVQVRGRGDAYYSGGIEPRAEGIQDQPAFDPLALAVREAHARGIEVHAWMNAHLISSASVISRDPAHLVNERPGLLAVPRELARELYDVDPTSSRYFERLVEHALADPDGIEGLYSSPSAPEVKERVYAVATDLVERYEIDGIHLDYVRYPSGAFDYSRGALGRFRTWIAGRLTGDQRAEFASAAVQDPLAFVDAFPEPWAEFRRSQITDLVERIYVGVKSRRPEVLISAAVIPDAQESFPSPIPGLGGVAPQGDRRCRGADGLQPGRRPVR